MDIIYLESYNLSIAKLPYGRHEKFRITATRTRAGRAAGRRRSPIGADACGKCGRAGGIWRGEGFGDAVDAGRLFLGLETEFFILRLFQHLNKSVLAK